MLGNLGEVNNSEARKRNLFGKVLRKTAIEINLET